MGVSHIQLARYVLLFESFVYTQEISGSATSFLGRNTTCTMYCTYSCRFKFIGKLN